MAPKNKKSGGIVIDLPTNENHLHGFIDAPLPALARQQAVGTRQRRRRNRPGRSSWRKISHDPPASPASRAAWIFSAPTPSSASPRCAKTAVFSGISIAERPAKSVSCGRMGHRHPQRPIPSPSSNSKTASRKSSPCKFSRARCGRMWLRTTSRC